FHAVGLAECADDLVFSRGHGSLLYSILFDSLIPKDLYPTYGRWVVCGSNAGLRRQRAITARAKRSPTTAPTATINSTSRETRVPATWTSLVLPSRFC